MRSFLLVLYLISSFTYATDWQQQEFSVEASLAQNSTDFYQSSIKSTVLGSHLDTVQLFEGMGLRANIDLKHQIFNTDFDSDRESFTSFGGSLESRLFLSDISNVDFSLAKSKTADVLGIKDARFQNSSSPLMEIEKSNAALSWQLGSVEKLRSLRIGVSYSDEAQYELNSTSLFRNDKRASISGKFTNRVSEDTSFVASVNHTDNEIVFAASQSTPQITGALLGFYTNYFGNSALEVLIGVSNRKAFDNDDGADVLSWQINNQIDLTDNSNFELSTKRELTGSPDPEFTDATLSDFSALMTWQLSENWRWNSQLTASKLEFSNGTSAQSLDLLNSVNWRFNDYLSVSGFVLIQDYEGDKQAFNHSGNNVGLSVFWELL